MTHMTMEKKVMTKKTHQIFGQEKCISPEKILAKPMAMLKLTVKKLLRQLIITHLDDVSDPTKLSW